MALSLPALFIIASISISGVYYDPLQAESGGEAIQLYNDGTAPVSLDSTSLVTKQTSYPLPATTLLPGSGYLVADNNWSALRDNLSWPLADLELPLSLANTDGYVSIVHGNATLDTLVWNSSFKAREGKVLTHSGEADPFFWNSNTTVTELEAEVVVFEGAPLITNITVTDDAPEPGIQLLSYNRTIYASASVTDQNGEALNVTAVLLDNNYTMQGNGSLYSTVIPFDTVPPGEYTLTIHASRTGVEAESARQLTVLSSVSISTSGDLVFAGVPGALANSSFSIQNHGNIAKTINLVLGVPQATCDLTTTEVVPGESVTVRCNATIPSTAAGSYTYPVRLIAS